MSYGIPAFFGKYLFSDWKMGMMRCPNIYEVFEKKHDMECTT